MTRPGGDSKGPFDQYDEHTFAASTEQVIAAMAVGAKKLGAEVKASDTAAGTFDAQFDKKMRGKILGDRSWVEVRVTAKGGTVQCSLYAFPLNAIGQKLMFGARVGVVDAVIAALWEETDLALGAG
jgi:hypothetical protein